MSHPSHRALAFSLILGLLSARNIEAWAEEKAIATFTSWEGAFSLGLEGSNIVGARGAFGFQPGNLWGPTFKPAFAELGAGFAWLSSGSGAYTPIPGFDLRAGWNFGLGDYVLCAPYAGAALNLPITSSVEPTLTAELGAKICFRLIDRHYVELSPFVNYTPGGNLPLAFGVSVSAMDMTYWPITESAKPQAKADSLKNSVRLEASPGLFSPDGDGLDDKVYFSVDAPQWPLTPAWALEISGPDGKRFKCFGGMGRPPRSIVWDGSSDTQASVDSGELYRATLFADYPVYRKPLAEAEVGIDILVIKEGDHYKIRVPDILFPSNSAELNSVEAKEFLEANRGTLTKLSGLFSRFPDYEMVVEGHANSVYWADKEAFALEQERVLIPLSRSRSQAVKNALVSLGVTPSRIRTSALGGSKPAYDFSSPDASKNRRVEFILVRR